MIKAPKSKQTLFQEYIVRSIFSVGRVGTVAEQES